MQFNRRNIVNMFVYTLFFMHSNGIQRFSVLYNIPIMKRKMSTLPIYDEYVLCSKPIIKNKKENQEIIMSISLICRRTFFKPDGLDAEIESELDIQSDSDGEILLVGDAIIEISEEDDDDAVDDNDGEAAIEMHDDSDYDINNDEDDDSDDSSYDGQNHNDDRTRNSGRDTDRPHIDDDEDDVIKAIVANTKTERTHPPDINIDDFVVDLSFHPDRDLLAAGTMCGDCLIYKYSVQENTLVNTLELHTKAIRDIEFSLDGRLLISASKDRSILITDFETGKYVHLVEDSHEQPISTMSVFSEHLFASGKCFVRCC